VHDALVVGDQAGALSETVGVSVSRWTPVPSAFMTNRSVCPPIMRTKAIRR
jgi:hypothetical protein